MRGTMLWFNETKEQGVIAAETGERLPVQRDDFAGRKSPKGRCGGIVVEFQVAEGAEGRKAEQVVLVDEANPRRARRRGGGR
jgi:cold shock CspA family protein